MLERVRRVLGDECVLPSCGLEGYIYIFRLFFFPHLIEVGREDYGT